MSKLGIFKDAAVETLKTKKTNILLVGLATAIAAGSAAYVGTNPNPEIWALGWTAVAATYCAANETRKNYAAIAAKQAAPAYNL